MAYNQLFPLPAWMAAALPSALARAGPSAGADVDETISAHATPADALGLSPQGPAALPIAPACESVPWSEAGANADADKESSAHATLAEALRSHISSPRGPANCYEILNVPRGADEQLIIQAHVTQIVSIPFVAEVHGTHHPKIKR